MRTYWSLHKRYPSASMLDLRNCGLQLGWFGQSTAIHDLNVEEIELNLDAHSQLDSRHICTQGRHTGTHQVDHPLAHANKVNALEQERRARSAQNKSSGECFQDGGSGSWAAAVLRITLTRHAKDPTLVRSAWALTFVRSTASAHDFLGVYGSKARSVERPQSQGMERACYRTS